MNDQQRRHSKTPSQRPHAAEHLEPDDLLRLGQCVRDLVARLGYGTHADPKDSTLFREAIDAAVYTLTLRQAARASLRQRYATRGFTPPESLPVAMEDLAQDIIHRTFADDAMTLPSEREQRA